MNHVVRLGIADSHPGQHKQLGSIVLSVKADVLQLWLAANGVHERPRHEVHFVCEPQVDPEMGRTGLLVRVAQYPNKYTGLVSVSLESKMPDQRKLVWTFPKSLPEWVLKTGGTFGLIDTQARLCSTGALFVAFPEVDLRRAPKQHRRLTNAEREARDSTDYAGGDDMLVASLPGLKPDRITNPDVAAGKPYHGLHKPPAEAAPEMAINLGAIGTLYMRANPGAGYADLRLVDVNTGKHIGTAKVRASDLAKLANDSKLVVDDLPPARYPARD